MNSTDSYDKNPEINLGSPNTGISPVEKLIDNLAIFYFDQKMGPSILYSNNDEMVNDFELSKFLDVLDDGTFILGFQKYQTINHISHIPSDIARGRQVPFMISYMIQNDEMEDSYRYLKSKTLVLEEFAEEIKKLENIGEILNLKSRIDEIIRETQFLSIYTKFYNKLSLKFLILKPQNELKPLDIDVFGIKLHLIPNELAKILNSILYGVNISVSTNKEMDIDKKILDFLNFLFFDSFQTDLIVKRKKFLKNSKVINITEKNKIEIHNYIKDSVKEFYTDKNNVKALLKLRDKIREIYALSMRISEFVDGNSEDQFLQRKLVVKDIEKLFYLKIKRDYFHLLAQVVQNYFNKEIFWVHDFIAGKIEKMWR